MNTAHWHLLLNHFPITGTIAGFLILVSGLWLKNTSVKKTSLVVFIFSALIAVPAFFTGEGAEELVQNSVDFVYVEKHEVLASIYIWIISSLGALSLITLITDLTKFKFHAFLYKLILLVSVVLILMSKQLATSGGEIRHSEIRSGADTTGKAELGNESEDAQDKMEDD